MKNIDNLTAEDIAAIKSGEEQANAGKVVEYKEPEEYKDPEEMCNWCIMVQHCSQRIQSKCWERELAGREANAGNNRAGE